MRAFAFLLGAALLPAAATHAQTPSAEADAIEAISSVQIRAPVRPVRVRDDEARQITGSYALSNGWTLKVRTGQRYIMARIDNGDPIRLLALAPYKFVSPDSKVAMEFNRGDTGDDMLMSYVADTRLGQVVVTTSTLARR